MEPDEADSVFAAIVAAVARGERSQAMQMAEMALQYLMDEPLVLLLAAEGLDERGCGLEALGLIERASQIAPEQAEVWRRLGIAMARQGRSADALAAFTTALDIQPDNVPTLMNAGEASYRLAALTAAERCFRRVVELAPKEANALGALAAIAARRQRADEARTLAKRALAITPDLLTAEMAIGRADLVQGFAEEARNRMTRLLRRADLSNDNKVGAFDLRADALDRLDLPAEAFADYQARNAILRRTNAPRMNYAIGERRVDEARRLQEYFSKASEDRWRTGPGDDAPGIGAAFGHAFLIGFPRSGTTLLETVLAAHPGVATLSEVDHLAQVSKGFLSDAAALDQLAELTQRMADEARQSYWTLRR